MITGATNRRSCGAGTSSPRSPWRRETSSSSRSLSHTLWKKRGEGNTATIACSRAGRLRGEGILPLLPAHVQVGYVAREILQLLPAHVQVGYMAREILWLLLAHVQVGCMAREILWLLPAHVQVGYMAREILWLWRLQKGPTNVNRLISEGLKCMHLQESFVFLVLVYFSEQLWLFNGKSKTPP